MQIENENVACVLCMDMALRDYKEKERASKPVELSTTAPNSPRDAILQALARGYCAPKNSGKELDSDLICAMADELAKLHPLA